MDPCRYGDLERRAIFVRELGSTGNYFRGAREQAHNFGGLGGFREPCKKVKNELKTAHL